MHHYAEVSLSVLTTNIEGKSPPLSGSLGVDRIVPTDSGKMSAKH